jgi:hypothetical protein
VIHARYLCTKLRRRFRKLKIIIGLWGATENIPDATRRLRDSGTDEVVVSMAEAVVKIIQQAPPVVEEVAAANGVEMAG